MTKTGGGGPTFALALGGGGARGLAHIHIIEALDELGIRPTVIAGSSIGAIMGAGMAAGMTGRDIHDHALGILSRRAELMSRMWRARPGSIAEFVSSGGLRLSQFSIERILRAFLPDTVPDNFEQLAIPLRVTGTDYYGGCCTIFDSGDLASALAASAALPAVFRPVLRDDVLYVDGGICNPVPFELVDHLADITIAVDVVGAPEPDAAGGPTSIDLMFGASQLMMQSITAMKLLRRVPDVFLRPPVSKFRVLDFMKIEAVLAETVGVKDELKRAIEAAVDARVA